MRFSIFIKDVATLMGGKLTAAILSMLAMPVISRLFHPEVYGVTALYVSIITILATVGTLSFPQTIILPKKDKIAAELFLLSVISLVIWAAMLWLALFVVCVQFGNPYPEMGIWLWTLPFASILFGLRQSTENWLTRQRSFKISAAGDVGQAVLTVSVRIASGLQYGSQLWPLISGYILGLIGRLVVYVKIYPSVMNGLKGMSVGNLISTAREFRHFPIYNMPAALSFSLNAQLPVLVIGYLFSTGDVGQYAMVQGLLVTTTMMVGESVRRVYLHRVAQLDFTVKQLQSDYRRMILIMGCAAVLPAAMLIIYGEPLFTLLLGAQWADAGRYAALLTPWFYIQWLSMPAAALVIRLKKQRFWLFFQQGLLWSQLVGMMVGYMMVGTITAVISGYVIARVSLLLFLIIRAYSMILEMNQSYNVRK